MDGILISHTRSETFIIPENTAFLFVVFTSSGASEENTLLVKSNAQIELDSATPYEPFSPNSPSPEYPSPISFIPASFNLYIKKSEQIMQTIPVNLTAPLYSLPNGVSDVADLKGLETHNIGVKVFDGTEYIREHGTIPGWFYFNMEDKRTRASCLTFMAIFMKD